MEIGFEFVAAKPKGLRAATDEPVQVPMRPREVTKNPSTDQKRVRRQMARQQRTAAEQRADLAMAHHLRHDHGSFVHDESADAVHELHDRAHERPGVYHDHYENQQRTAAEKGELFRHENHACPVCHKECPFVSEHGDVLVYNCTAHGAFNVPRRGGSKEVHANRVTATQYESTADRLNPGDNIRLPHGNTVKVRQVRKHETSGQHVYLDTDQGTSVVRRNDPYVIVPANYSQQELPGYGTPGGTEDNLPGQSSGASWGGQNFEQSKSAKCPMCGTLMSRQGSNFVCPRDGFSQGSGGAGGSDFYTDNAPQSVQRGASMQYQAALDDVGDCRLCGGDLKHTGGNGSTHAAKCADCGTEHNLQGKVDSGAHRISHLTAQVAEYDERDWRHLAAMQALAVDWDKVDNTPCPSCGKTGFHKFRGGGSDGKGNSHLLVACGTCDHTFSIGSPNSTDKYASLQFAALRWTPQYDTSKYAAPQMSAIARRAHDVLDSPEGTL